MSTKKSSTFTTTTNLNTGQVSSFKTTSKTSTPTNIGKGGLSGIGRLGMIAITILAVSVGSALTEFTTNDLIYTTPNYQVNNEFVPIEDPLNTIDYVYYGSDVFTRVIEFIEGFSDAGILAKSYWDQVVAIFQPEAVDAAVTFLTDFNRLFNNITNASNTYDTMGSSNQVAYSVFYNDIVWALKWLYYSPAELSA